MVIKNLFAVAFLCLLTSPVFCQDTALVISDLDKALYNNKTTITAALTDTALIYLHSLTSFRELIKKHATAAEVCIAASTEPGVKILINGTVTNNAGKPLPNILIYFYHTSDKGWYADTGVHILGIEGDHRHARLFGYVKTDMGGKFSIRTIRPNGYPKSDLAAHIHIQMWKDDGTRLQGIAGELQFDDDTRMTMQRRQKSISEGFLIAKNEGTTAMPVYNYIIKSSAD